MSGALAGLDHDTPAPEAVELPEWVLREETLWARVNDECRPVAIDEDEATWRLEHTTCVEDVITCGVTVRSENEDASAHWWCRHEVAVGGPVAGDRLRLVAADDEHAAYTRIVVLTVVPVGLYRQDQSCTAKRGREFLPPRPRGLDLFRTPEACAAFENPAPSVLAKDLGPSLGLCLRLAMWP